MDEHENNKATKLGELIRKARLHAGRSIEDCAQILAVDPAQVAQAEAGERVITLPELEALAIYLQVPMGYFWGSRELDAGPQPDFQAFLALRHRMVGAQLRQARIAADMSVEQLAEKSTLSAEEIRQYEAAPEGISLFALERVCRALSLSLDDLVYDTRGPLARHEQQQKYRHGFDELPPQVKDFVTQPANLVYLETALRLSEMDSARLRQIAEGILEITL